MLSYALSSFLLRAPATRLRCLACKSRPQVDVTLAMPWQTPARCLPLSWPLVSLLPLPGYLPCRCIDSPDATARATSHDRPMVALHFWSSAKLILGQANSPSWRQITNGIDDRGANIPMGSSNEISKMVPLPPWSPPQVALHW